MSKKILSTVYKSVTHHKDVACIVGGTIGVSIFATSFMIFTSVRDPDVSFANKQHTVSSNLLKSSATLPLIVQNKEVYGPRPDVPEEFHDSFQMFSILRKDLMSRLDNLLQSY